VIFSLAAPAVDILIEHTGIAGVEIGDDEACVGPVRAGFDAGDDAFDAAPARGPVEELLEAVCLAVFRRGIEARFRAASRSQYAGAMSWLGHPGRNRYHWSDTR